MLAVLVALAISFTMRPIFSASPFIIFFGAISLIAWYVGFFPALYASVLSVIIADYYFNEPVYQVSLTTDDGIRLGVFVLIVFLMNLPNTRRKRVEEIIRQQREWFRVCLNGIGDAVIATDAEARIVFMNPDFRIAHRLA